MHLLRQRSLSDSQRPVWPVNLFWEHRWHQASWARLGEASFRLQSVLTATYWAGLKANLKASRLSLGESYRYAWFFSAGLVPTSLCCGRSTEHAMLGLCKEDTL
eukprot:s6136_g4.t1